MQYKMNSGAILNGNFNSNLKQCVLPIDALFDLVVAKPIE